MHLLRYGGPLALLLALAAPARAAEPDASTRAAARKIATEGVTALQKNDAEVASQKLEKAFELLPAPSIALWSARALAKRGLLVEAAERYLQAGRLPSSEGNEQAVQAQAQRDAARELDELSPRIPKLLLTLEGAKASEVQLLLDGKPMSSALVGEEQLANPGAHKVSGTRGSEQTEQTFSLVESQRGHVVLRFHGPPPQAAVAPPSTPEGAAPASNAPPSEPVPGAPEQRSYKGGSNAFAIVTLVVGGAGLIAGGVTGGLALSKRSALNDKQDCESDRCLPTVKGEVENYRTLRTASTVSFIAGGVLAATGIVLLIAGGSSSSEKGEGAKPTLALGFAPSNVSLLGSF